MEKRRLQSNGFQSILYSQGLLKNKDSTEHRAPDILLGRGLSIRLSNCRVRVLSVVTRHSESVTSPRMPSSAALMRREGFVVAVAAIVVAHGVALSAGTAAAAGVGAAPAVDVAQAKALSLTTVHIIIAHSHNDSGWSAPADVPSSIIELFLVE